MKQDQLREEMYKIRLKWNIPRISITQLGEDELEKDLLTLINQHVKEVIGEDEVAVSPQEGHFYTRNLLREEQRERAEL